MFCFFVFWGFFVRKGHNVHCVVVNCPSIFLQYANIVKICALNEMFEKVSFICLKNIGIGKIQKHKQIIKKFFEMNAWLSHSKMVLGP